MSDKIIYNSDNFRIKCLSYSKISAILCVLYFLFQVLSMERMPSSAVIQEIEIIQNQVGKALLRVPQSTANIVVLVELGWKPF